MKPTNRTELRVALEEECSFYAYGALAWLEDHGFAVVPLEATEEMFHATMTSGPHQDRLTAAIAAGNLLTKE